MEVFMPTDENATATPFMKGRQGQQRSFGTPMRTPLGSKTPMAGAKGGAGGARSALGNITNKVPASSSKGPQGNQRKALGDISNNGASVSAKKAAAIPAQDASSSKLKDLATRYAADGVENMMGMTGKELAKKVKEQDEREMQARVAAMVNMPDIVHATGAPPSTAQELKVEQAFSKVDKWEHLPVESEQLSSSDDPFALPAGAGSGLDFALPSGSLVCLGDDLSPRKDQEWDMEICSDSGSP